MTYFPVQALRSAQEVSKEAEKIIQSKKNMIIVVGPWDYSVKLIAQVIRSTHRSEQWDPIPMPSTVLLAQMLTDNYSNKLDETMFKKQLVLDEQPMPAPFTSKPQSYLLEKLHYAYNLLTVILDKRQFHQLQTFIVVPKVIPFIPTTTSFYSFFAKYRRNQNALVIE